MTSTSGSKPPSRPPSPPTPPPHFVRHKRKQETEQEAEVEADKPSIKEKYRSREGKETYQVPADDAPPETSEEAQRRHVSFQDPPRIDGSVLSALKSMFLEVSDDHESLPNMLNLHKRKQETEQEAEVEAEKPSIKEKYPSREGKETYQVPADDAPPETSEEAQRRLVSFQDPPRIDGSVLSALKSLFLEVSDDHESLPTMLNLSEIVARIFQTERWGELVDNLLEDIRTNFQTRQEMAVRVFLFLPAQGACKFLSVNHKSLYLIFFDLFDSPNLNIQALTFDASVKLISLVPLLSHDRDLLLKMIVWLQLAFRKGGQIDVLEPRIMDLVVFARYNTNCFVKSLDSVLTCIFEIVETVDVNFIKCQAIEIFKILQKQFSVGVSHFLRKLSKESKRSIVENCVRLMYRIEDLPSWYDMDTELSRSLGISGNYQLGKLLLLEVCFYSKEDLLLSFGIEMIPHYLNSEDWQTRHAGVIAFAAIGRACGPEGIREQTERVVDISLADPHPRVRWAAIESIFRSASDHEKEHVQYLIKFLPRLVTIIRSSASIYPRVQFDATIAVRLLINKCDNEEVIRSFSEDLVPELLKLLEQGEMFRAESMEILISLASSFPIVFCSLYQETVDSLKHFASQSLLGAKSIESLSCIFSWFFEDDESPFLLSDANEVFTIVFKILDDWTNTDDRVKIHILMALSQLCKLPQTDELLNKTMPALIQILKNTKDSTTTTLIIEKKQISNCSEQRILACHLLSRFVVQFLEQFAPWASKVSPLLISLFRSADDDDDDDDPVDAAVKIASIDALPSVLLSCLHRKESHGLINSTVRALVKASQKESIRAIDIVMLKSLNACITISGSVFSMDLIKQIVVLIDLQVSQRSLYAVLESSADVTDYELEQEEEIIEAAKCLETMIETLKSAFLPHVDELLPAVEALWDYDNNYPDKVKAVAISIFNLLLKDNPYKLQRYCDSYPLDVMDFCNSESPQLQREAAHGIGLCAKNRELMPNFDALEAINRLFHVIQRSMESERRLTYDAAVSALGKIYEFRHDTINGPQVVPIWLNFLPLRNDFDEANYAHQQLCRLLEKADPNLLGPNNENRDKITQILLEVLSQSWDHIETDEETTCSIISSLTRMGVMS